MRVISQDHTIDLPYEKAIFIIEEDSVHLIKAIINNNYYIMAEYNNLDTAKNALLDLSKYYGRMLISPVGEQYQTVSDELSFELDKAFSPIEIKYLENTVYIFPEDK